MKIKEEKHNHKLTDLLKVFLFAIFLLLPFISVASKSLYVICNKNAKDSYYGETINETQLVNVNNNNQMIVNEKYKFTGESGIVVTNDTYVRLYYTNATNIYMNPQNTTSIQNIMDSTYFRCTYYGTTNYIVFYDNANIEKQVIALTTYQFSFDFTLIQYENNNRPLTDIFNGYLSKYEYNKYSYLDNVFEYSINQLQNSTWFNWVENTTTYTTIKAMTDELQIQLLVIPMLLTYWFLLIVIYLIIDIVMKVITTLTHMIGIKS